VVHVWGEVCINPPIARRTLARTDARLTSWVEAAVARAPPPLDPRRSTLTDPDSSSIAGRRASGFLQVSLSKVSRHPHRGAHPASSAETPPMNTNDYSLPIPRAALRPVAGHQPNRRRLSASRTPMRVLRRINELPWPKSFAASA
jgi:hypothetical protein